ncbi:hypothetical protein DRD53_11915 [Salmonella enterica subsp. enterica serovar Telelkebir]|uniref:hypothetical protein n=1 Tax=Salmonella enterica TaxID=28901 RepID=UPI0012C9F7D6|nr:hypothetical protein [Salmonella enterica]EBS5119656.1 hypothetical protein [Salmonella enterica subsp. enterica serovar Telelkebir]MCU7149762.1 hypothetical protein [Salmonella enterica]
MPICFGQAGDPRFLKFCVQLPEPGLRLIDLCRAGDAVNGVAKTVLTPLPADRYREKNVALTVWCPACQFTLTSCLLKMTVEILINI